MANGSAQRRSGDLLVGLVGQGLDPFPMVAWVTNRCLAGIRVRTNIDERVAVRWPAAEEASLDRGLRGHRGADTCPDASAFAFAHAAVQAHHEVVRFGPGIDGATDFGHPELDAVVREHRKSESELVAVERALRLSDDDRLEAARGVPSCSGIMRIVTPTSIAARLGEVRQAAAALRVAVTDALESTALEALAVARADEERMLAGELLAVAPQTRVHRTLHP
jgi:hypothetical protein